MKTAADGNGGVSKAVTPAPGAKTAMAFPLSAKILTWLFLNLLFLGIVAVFVVQGQFRFGLDSLLTGRAGERLQALSKTIASELGERPRDEWPSVLKRYADAYQVQLGLVRNAGTKVAGEIPELPAAGVTSLGPPP